MYAGKLQAAAELKRSEWVKAQRKKEAQGRSELGKESTGLRRQLKAAEGKALAAQAALAQAERDALEATRSLERYLLFVSRCLTSSLFGQDRSML